LKATNTDIAVGKYLVAQTPFLQEEDLSFFEGSKITQRSQHCYH